MKYSILIFCFLSFGKIHSQTNYALIDAASRDVFKESKSYREVAAGLTSNLTTDEEKYRAIYIWIAHNIHYDFKTYQNGTNYPANYNFVEGAMQKRTGVCQHYAELFQAMCRAVGLESHLIAGYTDNSLDQTYGGHAWNAVMIDSTCKFIDVTWASGYVMEGVYVHAFRDDYFLIAPRDFIRTHIPTDPIWQCLNPPITHQDFKLRRFDALDQNGSFHYLDSIREYQGQSKLEKYLAVSRRIQNESTINPIVRQEYENIQNQIAYLKFNMGIDSFNLAVADYNTYINYKNNFFSNPPIADDEIKALVNRADDRITYTDNILRSITSSDNELNKSKAEALKMVLNMKYNLDREQAFVEQYVNKSNALRNSMFFKPVKIN